MSGASPFMSPVLGIFVNGALAIVGSDVTDVDDLAGRINSGSMDCNGAKFSASLIYPGEPLPGFEASDEDRKLAIKRLSEELEHVGRPSWAEMAAGEIASALREQYAWSRDAVIEANGDVVSIANRKRIDIAALPPAGGGWNPAAADRLRRKNKRRGRR